MDREPLLHHRKVEAPVAAGEVETEVEPRRVVGGEIPTGLHAGDRTLLEAEGGEGLVLDGVRKRRRGGADRMHGCNLVADHPAQRVEVVDAEEVEHADATLDAIGLRHDVHASREGAHERSELAAGNRLWLVPLLPLLALPALLVLQVLTELPVRLDLQVNS